MESRENSPFLTVPYQSIFVLDLKYINECYFEGDFEGAKRGLIMLYSDLLEKPRKAIKEKWEKFLHDYGSIQVIKGSIALRTMQTKNRKIDFLANNIPIIKSDFIRVLEKYKLLNLELGAKPKYSGKKHLKIPS